MWWIPFLLMGTPVMFSKPALISSHCYELNLVSNLIDFEVIMVLKMEIIFIVYFFLNVFIMQVEHWLITYRSAVILYWMRTPSFTSLYRSYLPCTTSTTNLSCTETSRRRIFFWTSTRWSSKLEILASPKSLSARAKLTRWVDCF